MNLKDKRFSQRSISIMMNLNITFRDLVYPLIVNLYDKGFIYVPYSGRRTYEEQSEKWNVGRDSKGKIIGKIVTYKKPGTSLHEKGLALDVYRYKENVNKTLTADWDPEAYSPLVDAVHKSTTLRLAGSNFELGHIELDVSQCPNII